MNLRRREILNIGRVGLGLAVLFIALWVCMNRLGFARAPIKTDLEVNLYVNRIVACISLFINLYFQCSFVTGYINRFAIIALLLLTALLEICFVFFPNISMVTSMILPTAFFLIYAALLGQNMFRAVVWSATYIIILPCIQIFFTTVHLGGLQAIDKVKAHFITMFTINIDQDVVLAFACAAKTPPPLRERVAGNDKFFNFLFPSSISLSKENILETSYVIKLIQTVVVSTACVVIGGFFIGISVMVSYLAFAYVIKNRWYSENPLISTAVYALVLSGASAFAAFFSYPLFMPVVCGFLSAYLLYRLGLTDEGCNNQTITSVYADTSDGFYDGTALVYTAVREYATKNGQNAPSANVAIGFDEIHFSWEELAVFSFDNFDNSNIPLLKHLIEISGINSLYEDLLNAKYCEKLSGYKMENRFQSMGVRRTRQRHLKRARDEIIAYRDCLLEMRHN